MARSEPPHDELSDDELTSFEDALGELGERVTEALAEGTDETPEEIEKQVQEYDMPDPVDDRLVADDE